MLFRSVKVDGSGCYDRIVDNYKKLVEKRGDKEYYVRGTYTKYNLDFSEDVMHLYNAGFDQVSVEPVMEDESVEYAITEKDLDQIYAEYDKLVDQIAEIKDNGGAGDEAGNRTYERPILRRLFYEDGCKRD